MENVIEGLYVRDLLEQPAALARAWEALAELPPVDVGRYRRIVLTGMGSSQHALYPLHLRLIEHGLSSHLVETAELLHYQRDLVREDSLLIAVSQSGRSAELVMLLDEVRGKARVIGVTNTPGTPLAAASDVLLEMRAGEEATVSCKTYVATLLVLEWLAAHLTGEDRSRVREKLGTASAAVGQYLARWREHVAAMREYLAPVRRLFLTGRGRSLAAVECGGLILKESTRFNVEGMSCPAFRHGPFEVLRDDVMVVVLAGDERTAELNRRLAADVESAGGRARVVDTHDAAEGFAIPKAAARILPILEILPVQMITLALADLGGFEAGVFRLNTKVTTTA